MSTEYTPCEEYGHDYADEEGPVPTRVCRDCGDSYTDCGDSYTDCGDEYTD